MSGTWLEIFRTFVSLLLMGAAVKLMDDSLDAVYDEARGQRTLAARLGRSALPYVLLLGVVATALNREAALAAFLGSYVAGMFTTLDQKLPSRLPAWLEVIVIVVLALATLQWQDALWGIAMMSVIDWLDDLVDYASDKVRGQWNLAHHLGVPETLLLILIALVVAVLTNPLYTAVTFVVVPVIETVAGYTTIRVSRQSETALSRKHRGVS